MDEETKRRQIEQAYEELEEQWAKEYDEIEPYEISLYDSEIDTDIGFGDYDENEDYKEKERLIEEIKGYQNIGISPLREVNLNSSIEELEKALDYVSQIHFEMENEEYEKATQSSNSSHYPDIDEEDIMDAIMGGYGDIFGY